jgi:energy-coupling factor transporter ATP-binding protein EcfA2
MIALRDVSVTLPPGSRDPKTVLQSVSMEITSGEWVALLGPNGSGKTTLLHTIAGLIPASSGRVESVGVSREAGRTPSVSLLLQEPDNQFVTSCVRHELLLSVPAGLTREDTNRRVEQAVERFGLAAFTGRNPHRLSGGEKQRLALATVWLQDPDVLLLDEPTAYLDDEAAVLCREFAEEARRAGVTIVWATPGGGELLHADRIFGLDGGRMRFTGTLDRLYAWAPGAAYEYVRPPVRALAEEIADSMADSETAGRLLATAGESTTGLAERITATLPAAASGVQGAGAAAEKRGEVDTVVRFSGVGFGYDGTPVIRGLELSVGRGVCVGLAGRNGAGKSTVLGLASGVYAPSAGTVDRLYARIAERERQNVFYLFQNPERLFFAETVSEELLFGLERLGLPRDERERRSAGSLEAVGLDPASFLDRAPLTLSLGEMRRVAFAIALSLDPEFLLLDEPTSCLDPGGRSVLERILGDRRNRGKTTLVASHDASFLAGVCDRMVWLRDGRGDCTVELASGALTSGSVWPGRSLTVLDLQDRLAELGVDVSPRAVTALGLIERLAGRRTGRQPR